MQKNTINNQEEKQATFMENRLRRFNTIYTDTAILSDSFTKHIRFRNTLPEPKGSLLIHESTISRIESFANDCTNPERQKKAQLSLRILSLIFKEGVGRTIGDKFDNRNSEIQIVEWLKSNCYQNNIMVLTNSGYFAREILGLELKIKVHRLNHWGFLGKFLSEAEQAEFLLKKELGF